jgi:hypothetical protein
MHSRRPWNSATDRARELEDRFFVRLDERLHPVLAPVSPSMVQPENQYRKLCERGIATTAKCATIGSVQESFLASHGVNFNPCLEVFPKRQINGQACPLNRSRGG